jgi:hypothetical protein
MQRYFRSSTAFEEQRWRSVDAYNSYAQFTNIMLLNLCREVVRQLSTMFRIRAADGGGALLMPVDRLLTPELLASCALPTVTEQILQHAESRDWMPPISINLQRFLSSGTQPTLLFPTATAAAVPTPLSATHTGATIPIALALTLGIPSTRGRSRMGSTGTDTQSPNPAPMPATVPAISTAKRTRRTKAPGTVILSHAGTQQQPKSKAPPAVSVQQQVSMIDQDLDDSIDARGCVSIATEYDSEDLPNRRG